MANSEPEKQGWWGVLDVNTAVEGDDVRENGAAEVQLPGGLDKGKGKAVDVELDDNARLIQELQAWQELRVRKGDDSWISEREQHVGE